MATDSVQMTVFRRSSVVGDLTETMVAVPAGVLLEVLLVVVLGVVELARVRDLGRDRAEALFVELGLILLERCVDDGALFGASGVDGAAVLRADVVALLIWRRGVVVFPEHLQERVEVDDLGVVDDKNGLGMSGLSGAGFFVGGVGGVAARVANGGRIDASSCQKKRSAPQKQPIANWICSIPSGNGGTIGVPSTRWDSATGMDSDRPASASSGVTMVGLRRKLNMLKR